MKLTVIGAGYVGLTTAIALAETGHEILCIEINKERLDRLKKNQLPVSEPFLQELLLKNVDLGRLQFSEKLADGMTWSCHYFVAIGSIENEFGEVKSDDFLNLTKAIALEARQNFSLIIKSTVPPGTCQSLHQDLGQILKAHDKDLKFQVFSNPEFLRQGHAYEDFVLPSRIVVGTKDGYPAPFFEDIFALQKKNKVSFLYVPYKVAEFSKLASNSFLSSKLTFMNSLALCSEKLGIDISDVERVISTDPRIGSAFIKTGIGFGGSCLPRDLRSLIQLANREGLNLPMFKAIAETNNSLSKHFVQKVQSKLGAGKKVKMAIWGMTFKSGTDDLRESPAMRVIKSFLDTGHHLQVYDPILAFRMQYPCLEPTDAVRYCCSAHDSLEGADVLCVLTEDSDFYKLSQTELLKKWPGRFIFDGRNVLDSESMKQLKLSYIGVGREFL